MDLPNCITDDITICINDNMGICNPLIYVLMIFLIVLSIFIHDNANYVD